MIIKKTETYETYIDDEGVTRYRRVVNFGTVEGKGELAERLYQELCQKKQDNGNVEKTNEKEYYALYCDGCNTLIGYGGNGDFNCCEFFCSPECDKQK